MSGLSLAHRTALAAVLDQCSDAQLDRVGDAVRHFSGDRADDLKRMAMQEVEERQQRDLVMEPFLPLFRPRADDFGGPVIPSSVLPRLWKVIRRAEPKLSEDLPYDVGRLARVADQLCAAGARLLRDEPDEIWPGHEADPSGLDALIGCLELSPFVRQALPSLPAWTTRPDEAEAATLRLIFKDCLEQREDGGQLLLEVLLVHLPNPARILRVVTQTSSAAANERVLASSELGGFVDRTLNAVRARALAVALVRPDADRTQLQAAMDEAHWCASVLNEIDVALTLRPDGRWATSVAETRAILMRHIGGWLKAAPRAVAEALPLERVIIVGRMSRFVPRLDAALDGPTVRTAAGLARIVGLMRGAAAAFGCEAERFAAAQEIEKQLFEYADEGLQLINDGEASDPRHALSLMRLAAEWLDSLGSGVTAESIRRRTAVAALPKVV